MMMIRHMLICLVASLGLCLGSSLSIDAAEVLFVGGAADAGQGDDIFVLEHLEDVLKHNVTYLVGDDATTGDGADAELIVISSTLGSGSVRGKFQDLAVPILQWEEALIRWNHGDPDGNFRMASDSRNGQGRETTLIEIVEEAVGHPLAAGLPAGEHEIFDDINRTPQSFGELPPGLIRIGALDPEFADDVASFWEDADGKEVEGPEFVLTAIDKGGELGPPGEDFFAPEKRVNFPIEDLGFGILNDTGLSLFNASIDWLLGGTAVLGDYNNNGELDAGDLDLQSQGIKDQDLTFDLNEDGNVDFADRLMWVDDLKNTWVGDANLNGEFDSGDLVDVFASGKYETSQMANWTEGDWDGNMTFDSGDLVVAFSHGGYEQGPMTAAVPEPSSTLLLGIGMIALGRLRKRRKP